MSYLYNVNTVTLLLNICLRSSLSRNERIRALGCPPQSTVCLSRTSWTPWGLSASGAVHASQRSYPRAYWSEAVGQRTEWSSVPYSFSCLIDWGALSAHGLFSVLLRLRLDEWKVIRHRVSAPIKAGRQIALQKRRSFRCLKTGRVGEGCLQKICQVIVFR